MKRNFPSKSFFIRMVLFFVILQLTSCAIGYNSIQYKKSDSYLMRKVKLESDRNKFRRNKTFVHIGDSTIQLDNVVFSEHPYYRELTASIVETDSIYSKVYEHTKSKKKGLVPLKLLPKHNDKYIKQTHIFVDSLDDSEATIKIHEDQVIDVSLYYVKTKIIVFILIPLGAIAVGVFLWLASKFRYG